MADALGYGPSGDYTPYGFKSVFRTRNSERRGPEKLDPLLLCTTFARPHPDQLAKERE